MPKSRGGNKNGGESKRGTALALQRAAVQKTQLRDFTFDNTVGIIKPTKEYPPKTPHCHSTNHRRMVGHHLA